MYLEGEKLVEIASQLNLPEGTVRRWKCTHKWDNERSDKKNERSRKRKRGAQPKNQNAVGNNGGAPEQNKNAEKFGFFSKYLPEETVSIIQEMPTDPLDVLWDQIQIAYAAIIRAQQIMYVRDRDDKTIEKIEEKDVRLLRYAVEQAFDGAMRDGALALLNRLVDSASEAANLEEELLNLKGEYQRSMENSKRGAFKRLDAAYKRKCRREKRMAKGQMLCADGKPVMFGETLYGGDGRDWLIVGIAGASSYDVYGLHVAHDGKKEKKPLRAEWLVHELTDAGEEV